MQTPVASPRQRQAQRYSGVVYLVHADHTPQEHSTTTHITIILLRIVWSTPRIPSRIIAPKAIRSLR
jgi:hypothetical protein